MARRRIRVDLWGAGRMESATVRMESAVSGWHSAISWSAGVVVGALLSWQFGSGPVAVGGAAGAAVAIAGAMHATQRWWNEIRDARGGGEDG